jgi:hypothetical protein
MYLPIARTQTNGGRGQMQRMRGQRSAYVGDGADASCWSRARRPGATPLPPGRRRLAEGFAPRRLRSLIVVIAIRFGLNRYGLLQKKIRRQGGQGPAWPQCSSVHVHRTASLPWRWSLVGAYGCGGGQGGRLRQ